jgi:hypothetical protein
MEYYDIDLTEFATGLAECARHDSTYIPVEELRHLIHFAVTTPERASHILMNTRYSELKERYSKEIEAMKAEGDIAMLIDEIVPIDLLPNVVIEQVDGIITNIYSDKPDQIGTVVVLDASEPPIEDPDFVTVSGSGLSGQGIVLEVQQRDIAEFISSIITSDVIDA